MLAIGQVVLFDAICVIDTAAPAESKPNDANKREERTGGAVQASAEALGEAAGEMRQGEEQLSPGVQEREVRRQPGEERDERLEFVTGRGKIF